MPCLVVSEMLIKIQETKSSLLAMASEKLDEITKRTILENDQLKMELRFQVGGLGRRMESLPFASSL